ncbi:pyridoxamine 5'-phosphate oxidase family protein [Roseibium sp. RKSG952]|uniref:pyridoxamine 5'-phosphate oxidase family protein n=1 Tax=Roseibium sp. RKSG952 TaxID=2529384 RepID=UPI0012BCFE11|nr:pyridoxamine 5'-phosphate oxidase family protein [Roseibium sp. RKSG952]MTH98329.1 pyridoxamine 5'-phosphate oxidase family protein [Roseibium sp. RKSG952]
MHEVTTIEQLEALYGTPGQASLTKELDHLTPAYRKIIEHAPFCALATAGPEGLDCSPRGDAGTCVVIENEKTLLMPDRRGNNRIDSLRNIVRDPRVALMFLIPGVNSALRVNGTATISIDPELLARLEMKGHPPRSVVRVTIDAVYFQCARALMRAQLWDPSVQHDPKKLPSPGMIMQEIAADFDGKTYDREWPERAAKTMW